MWCTAVSSKAERALTTIGGDRITPSRRTSFFKFCSNGYHLFFRFGFSGPSISSTSWWWKPSIARKQKNYVINPWSFREANQFHQMLKSPFEELFLLLHQERFIIIIIEVTQTDRHLTRLLC